MEARFQEGRDPKYINSEERNADDGQHVKQNDEDINQKDTKL